MDTFEEYQTLAARVPISLRNNRDRINLPVRGLQEAAGKLGALLESADASGKFNLTPEQIAEVKDRLADILWCAALLCGETEVTMRDVVAHSRAQLQARSKGVDPDRR